VLPHVGEDLVRVEGRAPRAGCERRAVARGGSLEGEAGGQGGVRFGQRLARRLVLALLERLADRADRAGDVADGGVLLNLLLLGLRLDLGNLSLEFGDEIFDRTAGAGLHSGDGWYFR
jgi:hypothetical protein